MPAVHSLTTSECRPSREDDVTLDRDCAHARVRARSSASETVLTITGALDASNIAQIRACVAEVTVVGKSFLLDLSGVDFFAARGMSVLIAVDVACRGAHMPWMMVTSHAVDRALRISEW